jgi:hypothetical protein
MEMMRSELGTCMFFNVTLIAMLYDEADGRLVEVGVCDSSLEGDGSFEHSTLSNGIEVCRSDTSIFNISNQPQAPLLLSMQFSNKSVRKIVLCTMYTLWPTSLISTCVLRAQHLTCWGWKLNAQYAKHKR